jgi:hypothetical protein
MFSSTHQEFFSSNMVPPSTASHSRLGINYFSFPKTYIFKTFKAKGQGAKKKREM